MATQTLENYINGAWRASAAAQHLAVHNPATGEVLAQVPLSPADEVDAAAQAAAESQQTDLCPPISFTT